MKGKTIALTCLITVILFVSILAAMMEYYDGIIQDKNSTIKSLKNQLDSQSSDIANLTSQIASYNAQAANLTAYLGANEITNSSLNRNIWGYVTYNTLYITGEVSNAGNMTAYHTGLKVVAYADNGSLEINMTVPLVNGYAAPDGNAVDFGTDNATQTYASYLNGGNGNNASFQLGALDSNQTISINLNILHEGTVTRWTITPVWTNIP